MNLTEEQSRKIALSLVASIGELQFYIKTQHRAGSGTSTDFALLSAWEALKIIDPRECEFQRNREGAFGSE